MQPAPRPNPVKVRYSIPLWMWICPVLAIALVTVRANTVNGALAMPDSALFALLAILALALAGWALLARTSSLSITPDSLVRRSLFRTRSIEPRDVARVQWLNHRGSLIAELQSRRDWLVIRTAFVPGRDRARVIMTIHVMFHHLRQPGWETAAKRYNDTGRCHTCRYRRAGEDQVLCPECGTPFAPARST